MHNCRFIALGAIALLPSAAVHGAVTSQVWREGRLALTLDDGTASVEWLSPAAIRVTRSFGPAAESAPIKHDPVLVAFEDTAPALRMRSKYLTVEIARGDARLDVRAGDSGLATAAFQNTASGAKVHLAPLEKVYGSKEFFFTNAGYGVAMRSPRAAGSRAVEFVLYYGPAAKEILEQHQMVAGGKEVPHTALAVLDGSRLPEGATPLAPGTIDTWAKLAELVSLLNQRSLSAIKYPAFDLASAANAPADIKQRVLDLAALLPIVYRSDTHVNIDRATRAAFTPYLTTYLREGFDRGYPVIRPLLLEFPRDAGSDQHPDLFLLGDEFLLAPAIAPGEKRRVDLPRGLWTDLRTNIEYRGNHNVEIEAPPGRVPVFARNGSLFPLAARNRMELHYMPSLGGEFFLWEPEFQENSMFHAAPSAGEMRVEIETKVTRTYEWVLHHTSAPRLVGEETVMYRKVNARSALRAGTWWHDAQKNNLHVVLRAPAGSDRIVLVSP